MGKAGVMPATRSRTVIEVTGEMGRWLEIPADFTE